MSPKIILGCKDSVNLKRPDLDCHSILPLALHWLLPFAGNRGVLGRTDWEGRT